MTGEKHDWVVMAIYNVTRDEILAGIRSQEPQQLVTEQLRQQPLLGCYNCEVLLENEAMLDEPCPGSPKAWFR